MCGSSGHESCESQFDQLPLHEWEDSREGGKYDIGSVMHYGMLLFIILFLSPKVSPLSVESVFEIYYLT